MPTSRSDLVDRRRPSCRRPPRDPAHPARRAHLDRRAAELAAASTDGWLYLVTVTGTTGARADLAPTLAPLAVRARAATSLPLYAGFGISTPEHARAAAELVDGVVVGSRAVDAAEQGAAELAELVGSLRAALDST